MKMLAKLAAVATVGLLFAGCSPTPPPTSPPPSVVLPSEPPAELPEEPEEVLPELPTPTPVVTPSPTQTLPPEEQYCADYRAILGSGQNSLSDEQNMDMARLSAWAGEIIKKYQAASVNAPSAIKKDYDKVVQFLKDFKATIDSGNQSAILAQMRYLPNLNDSMTAISTASEKECGKE